MAQGSEVCVFWDFSRNDWNREGCTIAEAVGADGIVTCQCNHLTNFAVLVVSVTLIILLSVCCNSIIIYLPIIRTPMIAFTS